MAARVRFFLISLGLMVVLSKASAQIPPPPPPTTGLPTAPPTGIPTAPADPAKKAAPPPPPAATAVAATVNGQVIPELAVYRAFLNDPSGNTSENRKELLNHLVDNTLVDQYLSQVKIAVEAKDVQERFNQIEAEAKKSKHTLPEMLTRMHLTEEDLRKELLGALRWEKFLAQQATEKSLREMFEKNPAAFNGSQVSARHILLPNKGPESLAQAQGLRKYIDDSVTQELTKLPAGADALTREKERAALIVKTFSENAAKYSTCPSKAKGGDLGYFPRVRAMVEPFAQAAFGLKPYQMSEPVQTEFGYHIILAIDSRPGRDVKFEDVRPFVEEIYGDRLRDAIIGAYKPRSKIEINQAAK